MPITAPHLSYEELGAGRVRWTVQERDYFQNDSGLWLEQDRRNLELVGGWQIFRDARVVCAISVSQGKVRVAPDRHDLNKYVEFDFGLSLSVTSQKDHIDIWREVAGWGTGSGFKLTVHGKGLKFLIRFTDRNLIPDTVQFGLTASGLAFDGRRIMDGMERIFTMPNLFAYSEDAPDNHIDVSETLSGGMAVIDLSVMKSQIAGTAGPWVVDPSITIQPATQDTQTNGRNITRNYLAGPVLSVEWYNWYYGQVAYIFWDLTGIEGSISSVLESLTSYGAAYTSPIRASECLRKDAVLSQLCAESYKDGSPWASLHGLEEGADVDSTYAAFANGPSAPDEIVVWDLTAMTKNLSGTPLIVQHHRYPGGTGNAATFISCDNSQTLKRPKLEVLTFDDGIPAPRHTTTLDTSRRAVTLDRSRRVMHPQRNGGNL